MKENSYMSEELQLISAKLRWMLQKKQYTLAKAKPDITINILAKTDLFYTATEAYMKCKH